MATEVGDVTSYKELYMQFADTAGNKKNVILNNPKNVDDGDCVEKSILTTSI
jgi:hypothetical protein